jgi:hypothetical protein
MLALPHRTIIAVIMECERLAHYVCIFLTIADPTLNIISEQDARTTTPNNNYRHNGV